MLIKLFQTIKGIGILFFFVGLSTLANAQVPPSDAEKDSYTGLLAAAAMNDTAKIKTLAAKGANLNVKDKHGRTPLHVAAFASNLKAMRALVTAGANPNILENDSYDIVTILAVDDNVPALKLALELGGSAKNITSRYDGTALIAAAHLGHAEVVQLLIDAGAPLDHINNLGWTAVIESIVLGNGGKRHTNTLKALIIAGADMNIADSSGQTPLALARSAGYSNMVDILKKAGAK